MRAVFPSSDEAFQRKVRAARRQGWRDRLFQVALGVVLTWMCLGAPGLVPAA
jgi:hypothetical protein